MEYMGGKRGQPKLVSLEMEFFHSKTKLPNGFTHEFSSIILCITREPRCRGKQSSYQGVVEDIERGIYI